MKGRHALHIILLMLWSFFCIAPTAPAHFASAAILQTAMGGPAEDVKPALANSGQAADATAPQTDDEQAQRARLQGQAQPQEQAQPQQQASPPPHEAAKPSVPAAQQKQPQQAQPDGATESTLNGAAASTANGAAQPAQPQQPAPTATPPAGGAHSADTKKLKLFGTVEFRGKLNSVPRWLDAMKRNAAAPLFADENVKLSATQTWKSFKASLQKMKPQDQLKAVNTFWNQWPYRTDAEVYGKPDYWATPREFRSKSGDCEDYCIVKYFTLKELGWKPEQMRIVVVMETIRRIGHAVLAVYLDGKIYILDILSKNVLEHTVFRNYIPQFSVNEQYKWMHLQPNKK